MRTTFDTFKQVAERWLRKRFAFPLLMALAAALLVVSEQTYLRTTSTLRGGIELTDARMSTTRLMQLLADAETAQLGILATGEPGYMLRYAAATAEIAGVEQAVRAFFDRQGIDGAAAARRVSDGTRRRLAAFERSLQLARDGDPATASRVAWEEEGLAEMTALRSELESQLANAAGLQQAARTSIYDALRVNRLAVGALTLVTLLSLFLLLRQLRAQDLQRGIKQDALVGEGRRLEAEVKRRTIALGELARHLTTVREDERARLARELHDELGGLLTAIKLELARARWKASDTDELLRRLERVEEKLNKGIALKRRIIEELRPSSLSNLGLAAALEILCGEMSSSLSVPVTLSLAPFQLGAEADLTVFRFVQEALTNIGKYASAKSVQVVLSVIDSDAVVEVRDDGVGFDRQASHAGRHGLSGMRFRAELLGGCMSVDSTPGRGATLRIRIPQSALPDRPDRPDAAPLPLPVPVPSPARPGGARAATK